MRSLSPAARHDRRVQVIQLRAAGQTYDQIAAHTGLSRTGAFDICKRVEAAGAAALDDAPRGRQIGHGATLDAAQDVAICALITDHMPDSLSLPYSLWTKAAVIQAIQQSLGICMSVRNTALYLARWGFGPHKPMEKARQRSPTTARRWLDSTYPGIVAKAGTEDAEINWADESELRSSQASAGSAATMEAPRRARTRSGQTLSVISTVNNKGQMRWASFAGVLDATTLIDFLGRRILGSTRKIILILNPMRVHHAGSVVAWLDEHEDAIEVFHLPDDRVEIAAA